MPNLCPPPPPVPLPHLMCLPHLLCPSPTSCAPPPPHVPSSTSCAPPPPPVPLPHLTCCVSLPPLTDCWVLQHVSQCGPQCAGSPSEAAWVPRRGEDSPGKGGPVGSAPQANRDEFGALLWPGTQRPLQA